MQTESPNPLIHNAPASDTSPRVQLHPLVLLTISDTITRHNLRDSEELSVGIILGQQNGREVTMEAAFECKTVTTEGTVLFDEEYLRVRLDHLREVYPSPQLDLVGWFGLGLPSGPALYHSVIQDQFQHRLGHDNALLLLFHPTAVGEPELAMGKLPVSVYEGVVINEPNAMDVDGGDRAKGLRFRGLECAIETSEAEMIAIDFVAKGGGNATAVERPNEPASESSGKGKGKALSVDDLVNGAEQAPEVQLSPAEEDLISSLTAKLNASKMLHQRISLLGSYVSSLPPSYLTDPSLPIQTSSDPETDQTLPNHQILRSISGLIRRLPILPPPSTVEFQREVSEQRTDVTLLDLLAKVTESINESREMGKKVAAVEIGRSFGRKGSGMQGLQELPSTAFDSPT
ncbi:hypothetical protein P152DRAFT_458352 [Eremomyces bilateralis CBS 781.70]|uniref:COP9 signalosome complex subunit 6 n=1 Tax=Eremomyces bilateralis CBS 781.70 TaxID=1392243 RepID=A0A6G1G390_9PEZI|nr:uncharacterized protein P152DRAFT_458352 [Eremomyces bilateralis CBS 781.70]KAF1812513.1 hypothetical protein P152DRAFT_458352 [Eremomyces bilateralis CBS 781.70]